MTRLLLMIPADLMALTLLGAIISSRRGSLAIPDRRSPMKGKPLALPSCRLCGGLRGFRSKGKFVQYGERHYAHQCCYLEAGKDFDALSPEQQAEFPRPLLRRYGIDRKE